MNAFRQTCAAAVMAAGALVAMPGAFAAGASGASGTSGTSPATGTSTGSTYQSERSVCGQINQDKAACVREAGAAAQASRQGNLTYASVDTYRQNALARCQLQPPEDRMACQQRVTGAGATTIDGSVLGGGAIRETVTTVPAPAPATAPMSVPAPAPAVVN